ncbi:MAG: hypothetical protein IJH70_04650 [Oscillospiraceae bacterium]|nr:hypothetical protein [Oscillospiraceae bacterium]
MKRETISLALNSLDDRHITDTAVFSPERIQRSPERIVYMKRKRIVTFALAAALMLVLGISAFAIWGIPRFTGTHPMPKTAEYTSLSALPEIEKDVGYPVTVPEHFSNGYAFSMLRVDGEAVFGESYEVLKEYYSVHVTYTRDGKPDLSLSLSPVSEFESISEAPVRTPSEQRTVSGVTVDLNRDHYKLVPEDYEKTEDDLAQEAAGHYYISFGSDQIEEREVAFADFKLDNVSYTLMDMAAKETSLDTLAQMAGEIIEEAKA